MTVPQPALASNPTFTGTGTGAATTLAAATHKAKINAGEKGRIVNVSDMQFGFGKGWSGKYREEL